jgi:hypothetical protein
MPYNPRTQEQLNAGLSTRIEKKTKKFTNFNKGTLNLALLNGWTGYWHKFEHSLLAVQLSGWIDFAGGPITEAKLEKLDLPRKDNIDLRLLNRYTKKSDLDHLVAENGVYRDPGSKAQGEVVIQTTGEEFVLDRGTEFQTERSPDSFRLKYETTNRIIVESGIETINVDIAAIQRGKEYNIGPGSITGSSDLQRGVIGVSNPESINGGRGPEDQEDLRERGKKALFGSAGGGTTRGIEGGLQKLDGVQEGMVDVIQIFEPNVDDKYSYIHGKVVVFGGSMSEIEEELELLSPSSGKHYAIRPTEHELTVNSTIYGESINLNTVEENIEEYISSLELGENFIYTELITDIQNTDSRIEDVDLETSSSIDGPFERNLTIERDEIIVPIDINATITSL